MKARIFFAAWLTAAFCLTSLSYAEVPQMINYQGVLTDSTGSPITGDYNMTFSIYDVPTEGTPLWDETQNGVPVENGVFSVLLGVPDSIFDGTVRYLGLAVDTDYEMTPRRPVVSVGYAFRSESSEFADTAEYALTGAPDDDWIVRGDTVYHDGNVGIGTSAPAEKLDVEGNIHASGSIFSGNSIGIETGDAFGPDRLVTDGPVIYVDQEFPWGPNTFTGDIKVGIGDDDPDAFLEVSANGGVAPGRALFMLSSTDAADGDLVVVEDDGDVGIGTPSPSEKLDVGGNIHASGSIISGSSITLDGTNDKITASSGKIDFDDEDLVTTGNLGIGIVAPSDKLHVDNGNIKISGAGNGIYFPDGSFQTSAGVGSAGSVSNNLDAVITGDNDADGIGGVILRTGSDDRVTVLNDGKVGIGTSQPNEELDVLGDISATGDVYIGDMGKKISKTAADAIGIYSNGWIQFYTGGTQRAYFGSDRLCPLSDDAMQLGQSDRRWKDLWLSGKAYIDGRVGIGTTDPKGTLDVNGLIVGGGTSGIKINSDGSVTIGSQVASSKLCVESLTKPIAVYGLAKRTHEDNLGVYGGAGGEFTKTNYGVMGRAVGGTVDNRGGYFEGDNYGVYGIALKEPGYGGYFEGRGYFSGNVGIGKTDPGCRLDVSGDVRATGTINALKTQYVRVNTNFSLEYIFDDAWYNDSRPDIFTTGDIGEIYIDSHGGVSLRIVIKEDGAVVVNSDFFNLRHTASDGKLLEIYVWPYNFNHPWFVHFTGAREGAYIAGIIRGGTN